MPGPILVRLRERSGPYAAARANRISGDAQPCEADGPPADSAGALKTPDRRSWLWMAGLIVALGVVVALAYARWREAGFHWPLFVQSLEQLRWSWLAASASLALLTYYGRALRWAVMIRPVKPHPSLRNLFTATAIGFTAIVLLGRAGEFVRPYLIASKEKVPVSSQLAAWALERIYDLLAVLLVFGFALSQVDPSRAGLGPGLKWILQTGGYLVGVLAGICLVVLALIRRFSESMRRRLLDGLAFLPAGRLRQAEGIVTAFVDGLASTRSASMLWGVIFYTFLEWAVITIGYFCLFRSSPWTAGLGLSEVVVFMGFVSMGSVVQIPGIGGGVQVVAVVVLTELFGIALEVAAGLALVIWSITFIVIVPVGLALGLREGVNWRRMKRMRLEVSM